MEAEFLIRIATVEDDLAVSALLETSYPLLMRDSYEPAALAGALPAMTKANAVLLASGRYYVAQTATNLAVGCGGWSHERPGTVDVEPGLAHLRHFATHPDWTGRAIGRGIYALCEKTARADGVVRFQCYSSLNAKGFYTAMGFRLVEWVDLSFGPGSALPSLLMERAI